MQVHRELEELHNQLEDVKNSLVLHVFGRIREDQFSQFQDWADACMADNPEAMNKLAALLSKRE